MSYENNNSRKIVTDDKSYIIDPLTTICKIALLYFMPKRTKIAINNHILQLQEYNYYQWFERKKNGDIRTDIHHLNTPLLKVIKWYIIDNPEKVELDEETSRSLRNIVSYAAKGLNKLQKITYHSDGVVEIILQYLINILQDSLNNTFIDSHYVKKDNYNTLSDKIKNNYESHIINSISQMLTDADTGAPENSQALIECVHQLLYNRDNIFLKMMKEFNTML